MACKMFIELPGGFKMPALGYGTWQAKEEIMEKALDEALEAGYRHIDTAFFYENEHVIGRVLKKWTSEGKVKREELFITTKLPPMGMQPEKVEFFMKKSLESLQLDYVDLYLIHSPIGGKHNEATQKLEVDLTSDFIAVWKKMEEQVDSKRTKSIGLSNFNIKQIERVLKTCRIKPANLQIEIHAYMQQNELVAFCKKHNISLVAYCPLGNPSYNDFIKAMGSKGRDLEFIMGNSTVKRIAEKHSKTPAQILLRHILQRGIAAVPKSVTPSRIIENISIFDFKLDAADMKDMGALDVGTSTRMNDFKVLPGFSEHPDYPFTE